MYLRSSVRKVGAASLIEDITLAVYIMESFVKLLLHHKNMCKGNAR